LEKSNNALNIAGVPHLLGPTKAWIACVGLLTQTLDKNTMKQKINTLLISLLSIILCIEQSHAGMLDDFETSATASNRTAKESRKSSGGCSPRKKCNSSSDDDNFWLSIIFDMFFDAFRTEEQITRTTTRGFLTIGIETTLDRASNFQRNDFIKPRKIGSPLLPNIRFDINRQKVSSNVHSNDVRIEGGESLIGVQLRMTKFEEIKPADSLNFVSIHGLYRLSYGNTFNINLGAGVSVLSGNENTSGLSLTVPFYWHFHKNMGVEYKPIVTSFNGNIVTDQDLGVLFSYKAASFIVGYRSLSSVEESLSGPYFGFSLRR